MVSFVGRQADFASALKEAVELEYDAAEAYDVAIARIESDNFKEVLRSFCADHRRHIEKLSELLKNHDEEAPTGPDNSKRLLVKGKTVLGALLGDTSILRAINSNEIDTNAAYERLSLYEDIWDEAVQIVHDFLQDERRHKKWLEEHISLL
jgi:rubrerythrin